MSKVLLSATGVLLAAALAALVYGLAGPSGAPTRGPGEANSPQAQATLPPQAPWEITVYPAASGTRPRPKVVTRVRRTAPELARLVRRLYLALFLDRDQLPGVARALFTPPAARALLAAKAGLPNAAAEQRTHRRQARIGVEGWSARRAAARVEVVVTAVLGKRRARIHHRGLLWLRRGKSGWRVIAFEFDQRPWRNR